MWAQHHVFFRANYMVNYMVNRMAKYMVNYMVNYMAICAKSMHGVLNE